MLICIKSHILLIFLLFVQFLVSSTLYRLTSAPLTGSKSTRGTRYNNVNIFTIFLYIRNILTRFNIICYLAKWYGTYKSTKGRKRKNIKYLPACLKENKINISNLLKVCLDLTSANCNHIDLKKALIPGHTRTSNQLIMYQRCSW